MVKDFDDFLGSLDHEQEVEEAFERFKIAVKLSNMTSMSMLRKYHDWLHS